MDNFDVTTRPSCYFAGIVFQYQGGTGTHRADTNQT
jgi:hypothetical protein